MSTSILHLTVATPASLGTGNWVLFAFFVASVIWLTVQGAQWGARRARVHVSMRFSDVVAAVVGAAVAVLIFLALAAYLLLV